MDVEQEDNLQAVMTNFRTRALLIDPKKREEWIENTIEADFLQLQENDDLLEYLIKFQMPTSQLLSTNLACLSMIASTKNGADYICKSQDLPTRIVKLIGDLEDGSVNQRFCVALFQKLSYLEKAVDVYFDSKMVVWILNFLENADPKTLHSFVAIYLVSSLYNIFLAEINIPKINLNTDRYGK